MKLCECGCGLPAPIATKNSAKFRHVKGEAMRFILGHSSRRPREQRFWEKVDKGNGSGCWMWIGGKKGDGYGSFDQTSAHRVSWEMANGTKIPKGMFVLHSCDTPLCIRPDHLSIGTPRDNSLDSVAKMRHCYGERQGNAIINSQLAQDIRKTYIPQTFSMAKVAKKFGVSLWIVYDIVRGRSWRYANRSNPS